jgi:type IV pilus assembly protein PilB
LGGGGGGGGTAPSGGPAPIEELKGRPLGRILTKMGKVSREQVVEALNFQKGKGGALGRILIDLGYVKDADVNFALAAQLGYEFVNLEGKTITPEMIKAVPAQIATTQKVLPIAFDPAKRKLTIAMANHENFRAIDDLRSLMGFDVKAVLAEPEQLEKLINKHYQAAAEGISDILGELASDDSLKDLKNRGESIDLEDMKAAADSNPVRKLINLVLLQAIKDKASDIHFEPFEDEFKMRYRIDGVLYEMMPPPAHIAAGHQLAHQGHGQPRHRRAARAAGRPHRAERQQPADRPRVSVLPTMFGESVVMRVLDRGNVSLDLDKLGLREDDAGVIRQLINKPNGIVIVTGPDRLGQDDHALLGPPRAERPSAKLITAEDPVEYDIDGIIQCQIKPEIELTFARILRAMLRQDPDTC